MRRSALLLVVLVAPACGGIDNAGVAAGSGSTAVDAGVDTAPVDGHVIDMIDTEMLDTANRTRQLVQINAAAYASALGGSTIDVSVSQDARDFRLIHPETSGSMVTMPVGTVIVRKVFDDTTGALTKITLMGKGPTGYDPTLGDWWFGVTDPTGTPLADANGGVQVGRLTDCHSCHIPRATDDYLFGVPAADQR